MSKKESNPGPSEAAIKHRPSPPPGPPMTKRAALKFLSWCEKIHQDYADNPRWCRGDIGSVKHHVMCVKQYARLIEFIKEITNKKYEYKRKKQDF